MGKNKVKKCKILWYTRQEKSPKEAAEFFSMNTFKTEVEKELGNAQHALGVT